MNRVLIKIILLCVFLHAGTLFSQQKRLFKGNPLELGVMLGVSHYIGDLTRGIDFKETNPAVGIICRYSLNDYLTLRGSAWFGQISGDDKNYDSDDFRKNRNLSFKSNILEFSGTVEWNILGFEETTKGRPWSPYLFAGLGVYKYNPKAQFEYMPNVFLPSGLPIHPSELAEFDGQWFELQPMATEGQESTQYNDRKRYALTQLSLPVGLGVKTQISEKWALGFEAGLRLTYNDYLDDVSKTYAGDQIVGSNSRLQAAVLADRTIELGRDYNAPKDPRGTSTFPDMYTFMGVTLTRKLGGGKTKCFQF